MSVTQSSSAASRSSVGRATLQAMKYTKQLVASGAVALALCACAESARTARQEAPLLQMTAPKGYTHTSVVLIGDPSVSEELVWTDGKANITVPRSGVVRLKSLGLIDSEQIEARLDGKDYWRVGVTNLHGARVAMFRFADDHAEPALNLLLESEIAKYLHERESDPGGG